MLAAVSGHGTAYGLYLWTAIGGSLVVVGGAVTAWRRDWRIARPFKRLRRAAKEAGVDLPEEAALEAAVHVGTNLESLLAQQNRVIERQDAVINELRSKLEAHKQESAKKMATSDERIAHLEAEVEGLLNRNTVMEGVAAAFGRLHDLYHQEAAT